MRLFVHCHVNLARYLSRWIHLFCIFDFHAECAPYDSHTAVPKWWVWNYLTAQQVEISPDLYGSIWTHGHMDLQRPLEILWFGSEVNPVILCSRCQCPTVLAYPQGSPYLLRERVKVKELAILYADTCFWTSATSDPSVTCRRRRTKQCIIYIHYQYSEPRHDI